MFFFVAQQSLIGHGLSQYQGFTISHSDTHTTLGRTRLNEWAARRRNLYLPTHNTQKRQTSTQPHPVRTEFPSPGKRATLNPRLRPRGHWDRHKYVHIYVYHFILRIPSINSWNQKTCAAGHNYEKSDVYELLCFTCQCSQIGQTGRSVKGRYQEHTGYTNYNNHVLLKHKIFYNTQLNMDQSSVPWLSYAM